MTRKLDGALPRRTMLAGIFGAGLISAAPAYAKAPAFLRKSGNYRRLRMYSDRTGETLDTIYWIDGQYISEALHEITYFMRDWRDNKAITYRPENINNLAATQTLLRSNEPFKLVSGYRSPATNAYLRSKSRGVAKNSLHLKAMAADVQMQSRSVNQIARAASICKGGGVGRYSRSNFVHIDCGEIRSWGA